MIPSYFNTTGLVCWNEEEISDRDALIKSFEIRIRKILLEQNHAWQFRRIETPILTPNMLIPVEYANGQYYITQNGLCLRPETTAGSYWYAVKELNSYKIQPPFVIWQAGKSFRPEYDQSENRMMLKEFWQQEFQCFYDIDEKHDYQGRILSDIASMFETALGTSILITPSERLPKYSQRTIDFMANKMEICSCSVRKDFEGQYKVQGKKKEFLVLEIAIGLDRCVYQKHRREYENS